MPKLAYWPILTLTLALAGCGGGGGGAPAPTGGTNSTPPSNVVVIAPGAGSGGSTSTSGGSSSSGGGGTSSGGSTSTATGQPVSVSGLNYPQGVAVYGSTLYVANTSGASISAISLTPPNYPVTPIPLTYNPPSAPPLTQPTGLAVSKDGTTLYVANWSGPVDSQGNPGPGFIDAVNIATGVVTPLASGLNNPDGLALSADGKSLFVANHGADEVLQISTTGALLATYFTPGTVPYGVYADSTNLYATNQNGAILKWAIPTSGTPGPATTLLTFNNPGGITGAGSNLYIADYASKSVSKVDASNGTILATSSVSPYQPFLLALDSTYLYFTDGNSGSVNAIPLP